MSDKLYNPAPGLERLNSVGGGQRVILLGKPPYRLTDEEAAFVAKRAPGALVLQSGSKRLKPGARKGTSSKANKPAKGGTAKGRARGGENKTPKCKEG